MTIGSFLKLVEIQTKVASMIPFLIGTMYTLWHFNNFNSRNFLFMLISLLAFDMATTAINNYIDYKKAQKKHGYGYESHNAIVSYNMKEGTVISVIMTLLTTATLFGVLLFLNTNIVILILGAMSFAVGVLYSFGPLPISRMPLGEIFSGVFMGFVIMFISIYIHVFDQNIVSLAYRNSMIGININIIEIIYILLLSIPAINGIANIMLANNICDIEDDIENKRYTLPVYIGRENALKVFKSLYCISFVSLIILAVLRAVPVISLFSLLTIIPVSKNIKIFYNRQTKKDTFVLSVKNFILTNAALLITLGASVIFRHI